MESVSIEFRTEMLQKIANFHRYLLRSAFRQHAMTSNIE